MGINKKYKGLGFVEALIAMAMTAIIGLVLMKISANAIQQLHTLDLQDILAQRAVSTAVNIQKIATEYSSGLDGNNIFKDGGGTSRLLPGSCYGFLASDQINTDSIGQYNNGDPDFDRDVSLFSDDQDIFRVMCFVQRDSKMEKLVVKVYTGLVNMPGVATTDGDIKDYEQFSVIVL